MNERKRNVKKVLNYLKFDDFLVEDDSETETEKVEKQKRLSPVKSQNRLLPLKNQKVEKHKRLSPVEKHKRLLPTKNYVYKKEI